MTRRSPLPRRASRFVVAAFEADTLQAMVCVALEHAGFTPVGAGDLHEAIELALALPSRPLAVVSETVDPPPGQAAVAWPQVTGAGSDPSLPVILLADRDRSRRAPSRFGCAPDLAGILNSLQHLTVG